ncbi:D-alanyl-D-alanine carboxypeptidase [Clostridium gasigenes]|nr:D-alanyl-D-alanine carboxypeptidase family protein [Clostridium gasigenes]MBU3131538.1 D-alanyl-D-alanine carboxypeptidase [Clostridium gasigenes]
MKNVKKIILMLLILLLTTQSFTCYPKAYVDEDNIEKEEETIDFKEEEIDVVDNKQVKSSGKLRVSAHNAIAIDAETREVLFEQKGYEVVPMASTTKILTALVAISYGDLDRKITISKNSASVRGSTVGYKAGEEIAMRELLFGLIFKSGNDAAIAIAEEIGGSIENFANIMNDFSRSLGLLNSHFESPHGLDSANHYSSAYDLAILTSKAMENEIFREICGEKTISKEKYNFTREYNNINKILWQIPGANGVKTGYTGQAGKCLVSSVNHEGRNIIMVVLDCTDRWNQTAKIFKEVTDTNAFQKTTVKDLVNKEGYMQLGSLIQDEEFSYGYKDDDEIEIEVFHPIDDIKEGDVLGKIILKEKDKEKLRKALRSASNINKSEFERMTLVK